MDGLAVGSQCFRSASEAAAAYCASVSGVTSAGVVSCSAPSVAGLTVSYVLVTQGGGGGASAGAGDGYPHPPNCGAAWTSEIGSGVQQFGNSYASACGSLVAAYSAFGASGGQCVGDEFRIGIRVPDRAGQLGPVGDFYMRDDCTPAPASAAASAGRLSASVSVDLMPCDPQDFSTYQPAISAWFVACVTVACMRSLYTRFFKGEI